MQKEYSRRPRESRTKMRQLSDPGYSLGVLYSVFMLSVAIEPVKSDANKVHDYWAPMANGGGINDVDIAAVLGHLVRLGNAQNDETSLRRRLIDQFAFLFGRRFLELMDLSNMTKEECHSEIKAALTSSATVSLEIAKHCETTDFNATDQCDEKKKNLLKEKIWAAKMINSWGTPKSGLYTQGQFLWYGSYHQCITTKVPQENFQYTAARYCLITIGPPFEEWAVPREEGYDIRSLRFQLGACFPPSCVEIDSSEVVTRILAALANGSSEYFGTLGQALSRYRIYCQPLQNPAFSSGQIIVLMLICLLVALVIAGTVVEYYMRVQAEKRKNDKRIQRMFDSVQSGDKSSIIGSTQTTASLDWLDAIKNRIDLESLISFKSQQSLRRSIRRLKWWGRLVNAVSLRMNVGWLASSQTTMANGERPCNRITCLYGIRVIAMIWVIVGHTYVLAMPHLSNLIEATERMPIQFLSQLVLNSSLSVDTFLLISGLLNCYMWCLRQRKSDQRGRNRLNSWLAYFGHRYTRLVIPYILIIAIVVSGLYSNLGFGPQWDPNHIAGIKCDRHTWWRKLLFLDNLVRGGEHCLPWMWHLAVDFQCFMVAPLFIIVLWKYPRAGCALVITAVVASALARGLVIGVMRLPTNLMLFLPSEHFRNDFYAYFDLVYQKLYFRCGPYLIGLLTGWLLATKTDHLRMWHRLNWKAKIAGWLLIIAFCLWPLFGLFPLLSGSFFSPVYNGIFAAVNRSLWSMGVAMIIISCHCQFGCSYLNAVLSWIGWWPFARLSYGVYLLHELVIVYVYFTLRSPITYEGHITLLAYFSLFTAISYAAALILFIIAEGPTLAAERLLFRRKPGRSRNGKDSNNFDQNIGLRHYPELDRQRMTERWSADVSLKSPRSAAELYTMEQEKKTVENDGIDEEISAESKTVELTESSAQASISVEINQQETSSPSSEYASKTVQLEIIS